MIHQKPVSTGTAILLLMYCLNFDDMRLYIIEGTGILHDS